MYSGIERIENASIDYSLVIFSDSSDFLNSKLSPELDRIIAEKTHPIIKHGINEKGNIYKLNNITQTLVNAWMIIIIAKLKMLFIIFWIRIYIIVNFSLEDNREFFYCFLVLNLGYESIMN